MGQKGFSLLEMVMVIVIMAILAIAAVVSFSHLTSIRVSEAANKLKADIQYAQSLAMKTRVRCGVIFSGNSYTVFENNDTADPAVDPLNQRNYIVNFNTGEFRGVTITSVNFGGTPVVKFDREGTPYDGNDVALPSAVANRRVALNNNTYVVVAATTGQVCLP
jgi:prepilin-type N-terminal cleavage/methylation domain-containing protein